MTARRTLARHGQQATPSAVGQLVRPTGIAASVVLVSALAVSGFIAVSVSDTLADRAVDISGAEDSPALPPTIDEIEGGVNLLLVGTDSCENQDVELFPRCREDDGGERNDVTMLLHISDAPRRVTVVSFPRDMIVSIPSCPRKSGDGMAPARGRQMLNSSYDYGGLACSVLTIEELTKVDIQFAAAIRWTGVINMSDAIGGVEVCVAADISDRHTGLRLTEGTHTLVGNEALQFLRIRHGIGDGSDLGRISNQQQFVGSMVRKLQSDGVLRDPGVLLGLATEAMRQITKGQLVLDTNLADPMRMVQIALAVKDVKYEDIVFIGYPVAYSGDSRVVPVRDAADVLFTALQENRPLRLTGDVSQGNGVEIIGSVEQPSAPTDPATTGPTDAATPPVPDAVDADAVELPSSITGQTAADQTCTLKER